MCDFIAPHPDLYEIFRRFNESSFFSLVNPVPDRSMEANLADLSRVCNVGTKKNSKGHCESWSGYK